MVLTHLPWVKVWNWLHPFLSMIAMKVYPVGETSVLLKGGGGTGLLFPPAMMLSVVFE